MKHSREWLHGFLRLGARAEKDGIPKSDVRRQEDTVLRALEMLDERPGIVLADEVGMGKTFEALGVAAAFRHEKPQSRIVVITPGPDLNSKWEKEFARFREMYNFREEVQTARRLGHFIDAVREHPIVVAPVTMFQSGRGAEGQTYLLSLYCWWKELHGHTANAILARFRDGDRERVDVEAERFLGRFELGEIESHLKKAFRRGRDGGVAGLDDLYETGGLRAFDPENERAVRNALYRARFVLAGRLMPLIDLLIVDEAHKLKNAGSLRSRGMRRLFHRRFNRALFLTATPFQLDVSELREIFGLFAEAKDAPKDLIDQVDALLAAVRNYQIVYDDFQATWCGLDPGAAAQFSRDFDADPNMIDTLTDGPFAPIAERIRELRRLKDEVIEPGFRQWMIRSLQEEKRKYRRHDRRVLRAEGSAVLPFLLYERLIAEIFRQKEQTHRAAAEINMVSSYGAAQKGALLEPNGRVLPKEAEAYRELLRDVLGDLDATSHEHPKLVFGIQDALDAADRGEKTLIFCSRIATLEQLRRELDGIWEHRLLDKWRAVYPDASREEIFGHTDEDDKRVKGRHANLQTRFHRSQDALYLALRERYLRTVAPIADWALEHLDAVVAEANVRVPSLRVGKTGAERLDYQIAKRCVEQAAVALWKEANVPAEVHEGAVDAILSPEFLPLGLDREQDEYENDSLGDHQPTWQISPAVARYVIGEEGTLWDEAASVIDPLPLDLRVRVVEQIARYLTYKEVPFLVEVLQEAKIAGVSVDPIESAELARFVDRFWQMQAGKWWMRIQSFLEYFVERDQQNQLDILDGPIRDVKFVRHTKDGESREKLREAFNTPLYPMILIANEVMQEGLDLHKQCRRIVHHDLVWNPAQLEQRVGRIDRLGSLINRLRESGSALTLDVLYPVIHGTIDRRVYDTVKRREKWMEFLLGAVPRVDGTSAESEAAPPLPDELTRVLRVELGPGGPGVAES